jgi:CBS domain-containing protein
MTTVYDVLMHKGSDVISALPETTVRQAAQKMIQANVGCILVEQDEKVIGIFTERDLLRRVVDAGRDPNTTTLREVMSSPVEMCCPQDDLKVCVGIMMASKFRHLCVVDNGEPVGVISLRDLALLMVQPELGAGQVQLNN